MLTSGGEFADGLRDYFRGEETFEGEAAGAILAEVLLLHRKWILSHAEKKK